MRKDSVLKDRNSVLRQGHRLCRYSNCKNTYYQISLFPTHRPSAHLTPPFTSLSRPFQPTPLGPNVHLPILINHFSPVPLTPFALLCPSYILFCLLASFLPLLYLLICKASRAKPICALLFPALPIAQRF